MNYDEENSGQIGVNFQRRKSGNSWLVQCFYKGTGIAKRLPHSEVGLKAAIKDRTLFEKDKESYMVAHFGAVIWLQKESARAEKKKAAETKRKAAEKKKAAETKPKKRKAPATKTSAKRKAPTKRKAPAKKNSRKNITNEFIEQQLKKQRKITNNQEELNVEWERDGGLYAWLDKHI